jgi:putative hydrolase of the HAD superfamily
MKRKSAIQALLFDLGGVVIEIDPARMLHAWAPLSALSIGQMRKRLIADEPFRRHERGELDPADFFAHLRKVLRLDADDRAVAAGWNALLAGEIPAALGLIEQVRTHVPCFALTNTSPSHQAVWSTAYPRVVGAFERIYASHELGMRKPEPAAFRHVVDAIGAEPGRVLFFDDSLENVQGAEQAGLRAVQVHDSTDIERALRAFNLL